MGKKEKEKEKGERAGGLTSSLTASRRGWEAQGVIGGTPVQQTQQEGGEAALICWRGVPEDLETLGGGSTKRRRRKGRRRKKRKGRRSRRRRSGTAAKEAEAAYQAVSCGDKQSPEVIGVHAACLFLLEDAGTAGGQAHSRQEGQPHVHSRETGQWQEQGDQGGPKRPGKGKGSERHRKEGGKRTGEMVHIMKRGEMARVGRQRRRERKKSS